MQIHELDNFSGTLGGNAYIAVDNGTDTGKVSTESLLSDVSGEVAQLGTDLNARIDNIIAGGSAPSEAEVTDARLGANGFTYASLGDAIREPIKAINEELEDIAETYSVNLFDPDKATRGYLHAHGAGKLDVSANFAVSDFIPVKAGHTYYQNNAINTYYGGFYDTDKNYVDSLANSKTLSIESDGFIRVTCKLAEINTCQVEEGTYESRYSNYEDTALDKMLRAYTEAGRVSFSDWRLGTITNGIVTNNSHRIANTNINDLSYPVVISADEGYRYVIVYYNEDSTWELDSDWINGDSFVPAHQRFRLLVACDPDAAETVSITNMATHIRVDRYRGELVGGTFNNVNRNVLTIGDPLMSINHRGYNTEAPENTLSAFVESKRKGFNAIETDVRWTSDGIPVLLHDETIDRTSNGTGAIVSMTYAQARTYDFGSWFSPEFAGEKIPSVEELLLLAKRIDLDIVLEVEPVSNLTNGYIKALVDMVNTYGMNDKVIFASFDVKVLWKIGHYSPYARLMINVNAEYWAGLYTHYVFLKTPFNVVGFSYESDKITTALIDTCTYWHIPYMAWTLNSDQEILNLNGTCLVGILSDSVVARDVFKERYNIQ